MQLTCLDASLAMKPVFAKYQVLPGSGCLAAGPCLMWQAPRWWQGAGWSQPLRGMGAPCPPRPGAAPGAAVPVARRRNLPQLCSRCGSSRALPRKKVARRLILFFNCLQVGDPTNQPTPAHLLTPPPPYSPTHRTDCGDHERHAEPHRSLPPHPQLQPRLLPLAQHDTHTVRVRYTGGGRGCCACCCSTCVAGRGECTIGGRAWQQPARVQQRVKQGATHSSIMLPCPAAWHWHSFAAPLSLSNPAPLPTPLAGTACAPWC